MRGENPIEVRVYGVRGPTVVVLHGGPGGQGSAASLAAKLGKDFRVLEPLQRRSGNVRLTVDRHVEDLSEVILEKTALVGWSWGAMLALSFAAKFRDRVNSLALIGCGTYDTGSREIYKRKIKERLGLEGCLRMRELRREMEEETDPLKYDSLFEETARLMARAQAFDPLDDPEETMTVDSLGHTETWKDVLELQEEGVEPSSFDSITIPVIMLHGEDDPHPGQATRDVLKRYIPHLEYKAFRRCGHKPWMERYARDQFLETLGNWLSVHCR